MRPNRYFQIIGAAILAAATFAFEAQDTDVKEQRGSPPATQPMRPATRPRSRLQPVQKQTHAPPAFSRAYAQPTPLPMYTASDVMYAAERGLFEPRRTVADARYFITDQMDVACSFRLPNEARVVEIRAGDRICNHTADVGEGHTEYVMRIPLEPGLNRVRPKIYCRQGMQVYTVPLDAIMVMTDKKNQLAQRLRDSEHIPAADRPGVIDTVVDVFSQ